MNEIKNETIPVFSMGKQCNFEMFKCKWAWETLSR